MKKTLCPTCNTSISNCNFKKHISRCTGNYVPFAKATVCKYCSIDLAQFTTANRANHVRWCNSNPKRSEYASSNNCSQMNTPDVVNRRAKGIKQAWVDGKYNGVNHSYPGYKHSEKTIEHLRQKALASPHRRLVRSIREYRKKDGTIVKLDSSWELALAERLDQINVEWIRPDPIKWIDKLGISHHYFPDFYLPEYNLYLDPKGPYAIKAQNDKIICLTEQIKNLIIITKLEDCKKFNPTPTSGDIC